MSTITDRGKQLWSGVDIAGPDECWNWKRRKIKGYGALVVNRHAKRAHRVAWELTNGEIPDNLNVLHRCDNTACCNPKHLFLGTHADNVADKVAKGRQARGATHGRVTKPHRTARGDRHGWVVKPESLKRGADHWRNIKPERAAIGTEHGMAKLTEEKVREIRSRVSSGENRKDIAAEYLISLSNVHAIMCRRLWKHVA